MLQSFDGYIEQGHVYTTLPLTNIRGRRRVIVTILDEPKNEKTNTWSELDKIVASMDEKPCFENFPRCEIGRDLINFDEV